MADLRHAGVGFPNGAVDNGAVFALPSANLLMLATEGRYHHDAAVAAGKRVLWRSIPRIGKRPAELGWSPVRFVGEAINLADAPSQPIGDLVWANELDLNSERGDGEDDWQNLERRYALIGGWAYSVVQMLKQWSPQTRIHWPAWTPDHDALDHLGAWRDAASLCDVVDFHAYDSLANIQRQYTAHRQAFPSRPLALTEWHCKGDVGEEEAVLQWLALTMAEDPLFDAAYFFIWRWWDHPGWWSDAWDIEHDHDRLALFRNPPTAVTEPEPEPMTEIEAFIREAARKRGINENIAVRVAKSEGGVEVPAAHGDFETGDSWWPFQLHYGGPEYPQFGTVAGMGGGFTKLTGWQPGDPKAWRDSVRYALNRAKAGGWGPWYGAAHVGIGEWDGIDRDVPWDANSEQWDYETGGGSVPKVTYNRDFPATIQDDDWSCAPSSLDWALRALGRTPGHSYIENLLLRDGIVSRELGLLDATGGPLAAWIGKKVPADVYYGADGFYGNNDGDISFDELAAEFAPACTYPALIGGRNYGGAGRGHWVGLRMYDPSADRLILANPAGPSGAFAGDTLTRADFARKGPFSLVRVLHPDIDGSLVVVTPPPPPPDPRVRQRVLLTEMSERLEELKALVG